MKIYNVFKRTTNETTDAIAIVGSFGKEADAIEAAEEEAFNSNEEYIESHDAVELNKYHFDDHNNGYAKIWREDAEDEIEINIVAVNLDEPTLVTLF